KIEVLRMCLQDRGESMWLCEVKNHDMDFKVIENQTVTEVLEDLRLEGLDKSFWSVRVVPADQEEVCAIPELRETFPYQYNFLFKSHHGLFDGNTVLYFIRVYTEILDDVLSGKTVSDDIRFGKFVYDDPLQSIIKETEEALKSDPICLEKERERLLRVTMKQPILYTAFPKPKGIRSTTRHIVKKVDNAKAKSFYKCCKLNNVSMTAGFEAVFNTALVEMVRDAGVVRDGYNINIRQAVSMRRYMEVEKDFNKFQLGLFLVGIQQGTYCKKVVRKHFWEHAQEIHSEFRSLLKNNIPIIESIVRPQVQGPLDPVVLAKGPPRDNSDYAFSNLLDLTPLAFYEGSQVQLTDMIIYNSINNFLHPLLFQFSTYRGFGHLTCSYDTVKVADDTAHELTDRIMNILDFVTK
ncbi:unnamed protein product, partial [Meganyctiphanes norvegica]